MNCLPMVNKNVCMFSQHTFVCMTVQLTVGFIIEGESANPTSPVCIGVSGIVLFEKETLPPTLPPDDP